MKDFVIDVEEILKDGKEKAEKALVRSLEISSNSIINKLMDDGSFNRPEGLAHEMLRKHIEDYVLSSKFQQQVEASFDKISNEQIDEAVKKVVNHRARKIAFAKEKNRQ